MPRPAADALEHRACALATLTRLALAALRVLLLAACGSSAPADVSTPTAERGRDPDAAASPPPQRLLDWPEFGLEPAAQRRRANARPASPRANVGAPAPHHRDARRDRRLLADLPARRARRRRDPQRRSWSRPPTAGRSRSTPTAGGSCGRSRRPATRSWAGSAQITTASPLADPDRRFVYAASPNGLIHKLSLANGSEDRAGAWPVQRHARRRRTRSSRRR